MPMMRAALLAARLAGARLARNRMQLAASTQRFGPQGNLLGVGEL
jgi:hypothetical protein